MLQLREEGGNGMGPFTLNERFMRSASSEDKDFFPQLFLVKSNIFYAECQCTCLIQMLSRLCNEGICY